MIVNVYFEDWSAEVLVISFGLIHGLGGASVALNLATISYIGDISTPETKVHISQRFFNKGGNLPFMKFTSNHF